MTWKVLIADDEPNIVISLEFLMQREGHEVRVARDGQQALEAVRDFAPDLVLLDVMMPVMDGREFLVRMRADARYAAIPVVVLSLLTERGLSRLEAAARRRWHA